MKRFLTIMLCVLLALVPACSAMAALSLPASLQVIEAEAFAGDTSVSGVVTLPSSVTQVGDRAFADTNLFALRMPDGIQSVGSGIVSGAGALYVEIPSTTATLADGALEDVAFLISPEGTVSSATPEDVNWLNADMLFTCDGFVYHYTTDARDAAVLLFPSAPGLSGEFTVPETANGATVVTVGDYAFWGLSGLTKVIVSDQVGMPESTVNWAENIEIEFISTTIAPVLPDNDREKTQFFFHESDLVLHPGDYTWLSPQEWPEGEWTGHSSDDSIATIDGDCKVEAHGVGNASLTVWVEDENVFYYATITVNIVAHDVTIGQDFTEVTLPVGEIRTPYWDVQSSSYSPNFEYVFESSDESVATHDDYGLITGVAPGNATVTLIIRNAADGQELARASADVTVVAQELELNESMIWAYDAFEYQLEVVTELPEGATVAWSSTDESIIVDENGLFHTYAGEEDEGGRGFVVCTVTYADGSTATASCYVTHAPYDISFDEFNETLYMQVDGEAKRPINAYYMTFPVHKDQAVLTLTSSDESIVSTDGIRTMYAHKSGTVTMTLTLSFLGISESTTYQVTVEKPHMFIDLETDTLELTVQSGERDIRCGYGCSCHIDRLTVTSDNPDVAKAFLNGDRLHIIPVCEGHAVVTVTMGVGDDEHSASVNVTVLGHTISLSEDKATLTVGESIQLTPVLLEGQEIDYNEGFSYWSSDDAIASVDNEGRVIAMKAGTAMIYFDAWVNGQYARAYCEVSVTDEAAQLTLSHTSLYMAQGDQVQLTAYLNGEAISGEWTVRDTGLYVTSDGLLTLRHDWPASFSSYVTCTVEADGETYTASCMVTGRAADVTLQCPSLLMMNVGDEAYIWANFSSNAVGENYTVRVSSSDESVACFPNGTQDIKAVGQGECTVTVELINSAGETVITRSCTVRVGVGLPELEQMSFSQDEYYIATYGERTSTYLDPVLYPLSIWDLEGLVITSSDENIVSVVDHNAYAVSSGKATVTMTHELYPDASAEATVYVVEPTFTASAEEMQCGDTVTFTITGLPEGVDASVGWDIPEHGFTQVSSDATSLTLRTIFAGEFSVRVWLDLPQMHFEHEFVVYVTGDTKVLNYSELTLEPDRTELLWANFGCWNTTWTSSDTDVAVVDENGNVNAISYGECDLILTGEADDGPFTVSCHVTVADGDWHLSKIDVPAVMMVGNEYDFNAHIESTNYAWPTAENWDLGEGGQLTWVRDNVFRATAPGQVTITFTCSEGEQVETASITVLVVEPAVRLANTSFNVRPGLPCEMQFITSADKEIQSVVWSVSQDWALSVDEKNYLTATADSGRYAATATVTLTDGTTHSLSAVVNVIPNGQIYLNTNPGSYNTEVTVTEMTTLPLDIDTNAFDDEITITWTSSDESIAYVEHTHGFLEASVAEVRGCGNGGNVTITCTVQVGDFITQSHDYNLCVRPADIWINLEHDDWTISINDSSRDCWVWYGNNLPIDVLSIVSDNTDVVRVFMQHDRAFLTPVAPGTATITASISARGYGASDAMTVTVEGSSLAISPAEATLNVGDVLQLSPVVPADQELDYNDCFYESSDASIAYVNGNGQVIGLKPGTARILLRASVNGSHVNAYCVVTVVDNSYPLTLNATRISLAQDETFQFRAMWNGEEISDVVWSVPGSAFSISSSGLLTMRHTWSEKDVDYITATVEREGVTYTATCMVTGKQPEVTILMTNSIVLNVGDGHWVDPYFSTTADCGTLSVSCISSDESILKVEDGQNLTALAAGSCELTVQLVAEDGTVVGEKTVPVYINVELPALESVRFSSDTYYLELNNHTSAHVDPCFVPALYQEQGEQVITSSDENVVTIDGHEIRAVGAGTATISICNALAPNVVATATVHVYDWQVNASATEVSLGDLITVTMSGLEDAELTDVSFNTDEGMLRPVERHAPEFTFRAMNPGEVWLQVHANAEDFHFSRDIQFFISESEGEYLHLNETDSYREPGHEFDLWPEFEVNTLAWSSTDEAVATVDESGHVKVVNVGKCEIVLEGELPDGTGYHVVCVVHAAWGEWTLTEFYLDDVLYVGNTYGSDCSIESTYDAGPDSISLSVEGDAVELIDSNNIRAVKAGTATVTLTASKGEHVESISKTVLVIEPAAYLEESHFDLRPGQSAELKLVAGSNREITGIVWSSSNEDALSVSTDGVVTMLAQGGQYTVTADVWLADGATLTVTAWISAISNDNVYFNADYSDSAEVLVTETCQLQLNVDTNALESEVTITWSSNDEELVTVENTWGFAGASVAEVRGGGPGGDATVVCTVDIGDFFHQEYHFNLHVHSAEVWIDLEHDSFDISTRDSRQECAVWYDSNLPIDVLSVVSDNPDVLRVFMAYDRVYMTPVAPGTATVTASISARGYGHSDTMTVNVTGSSVSLNVSEATLNVGDTLQLEPVVGEGQNLDYNNRSYESTNPAIAHVNGDGMISALKPGTARICLRTNVDGYDTIAWCSVTVVDSTTPLTLNASSIALSRSQTFQLKAMWNGEEISDVVWSSASSAFSVSSTGLLTMRHSWNENEADYVTATVEREGETYTATCMVTGTQSDISVVLESAIVLNVGDGHWVNPYFSTTSDYGALYIRCISSNPEILAVENNQGLSALAAGSCELTVQLVNEADEVVYEATIPVYINSEMPALESICFSSDIFYLDLNGESSAHTDPYTVPTFYQEQGDLVIASSDENVVTVDGYQIRAVGVGTATIFVYSPLAPDQVATATVQVYDWQVNISATEVNLGDLVTVTMSGLEDLPLTNMYCNNDNYKLRPIEDGAPDYYTFRAMHSGETWLEVRADTEKSSFSRGFRINIIGSEDEYLTLNETDSYHEPGHEFDLWPEFNASNHVWSSSDEAIATVDESGHVKVVGEGKCEIILECELPDGTAGRASCNVHAAWGEWTLTEFHLDDVIYVGNTYSTDNCHIKNTYNAWPDSLKLSVEGDAVELVDDSCIRAVKAGTATVTLTASRGEQVEFISKTVLVVEPAARLEENYFELRPGQSAEAKIIPGSGREISAVEWRSSNDEALTVTNDGVFTPVAGEGEYNAVAAVTLTDGTTVSLTVRVRIIPNNEIHLNLNMDDNHEHRIFDDFQLELFIDTNAYDGEISIEWSSDDESVVTVTPVADSWLNTLADLHVCGTGSANVTCTVRIGDFREESRTCYIWVPDYEFSVTFQEDVYDLDLRHTDQDAWLTISDNNIGHDTITVTSSDTSVVRAYSIHDRVKLIPVGEGTATLTVTMTRKDLAVSDTMEVVVTGKALELTHSSLELTPGESIMVAPVLNDGEVINQHNRNYQSSNTSVAIVDGDGLIHALSAGTTVITLETEIDVTPDDGETNYVYARASCTVTVTDPQYPLTLNKSAVSLVWQDSFQLQALWNGTEISDVIWSSSDPHAVTVSSSGLVYMGTEYVENHSSCITATVERDGVTYTATCLVSGLMNDVRIDAVEAIQLNVGDCSNVDASYTSTVANETYTLVITSSDESVARIIEDNQVEALASGTAALTIALQNSSGETVATRTCMVYVGSELPELEFIGFEHDVYFVTVQSTTGDDNTDYETYTGPYTIPNSVRDLQEVELTSADPSIARIEGHSVFGVAPGSTTITLSHPLYPDQTATATVYVFDLNPTIETDTIQVGDTTTLSVSLDDIPEEYINSAYWTMNDYCFSWAAGGWNDWTIRGRRAGSDEITFHLHLPHRDIERKFYVTVEGEAYLLNTSDVIMEPNRTKELWPEFECENRVWSSSDESVATVDQDGRITSVAYGTCVITLEATDNATGETVTATCQVTVADGEWHLADIAIADILYVGNSYWPEAALNTYYEAYPEEFQWTTSDSSILVLSEEDGHFHALKTGTVDVIVTATEGDQVETFTKTVYVTEPKVRLSSMFPALRPGASETLELVTADGYTVESVEWKVSTGDYLTVDDGVFAMSMDAPEGSSTPFTAVVTLNDGTVHTLSGWYHCYRSDELEYDFWLDTDYRQLKLGFNDSISAHMWTNAAEHETYLYWSVEDENILRLGDQSSQINHEIELIPVGTGVTTLWCHLDLGEGGCYRSRTLELQVEVINNDYVNLVYPNVWLRPTASAYPDYTVLSDVAVESVEWAVDDPDALQVDNSGCVTLLASEGEYGFSATFTMADGAVITLYGTCFAIPDGDVSFEASIWPDYEMDVLQYDYGTVNLNLNTNAAPGEIFIEWWSSEPEIAAVVDYEGQACQEITVEGVGLGYATIYCRVEIRSGDISLHCQTLEVPVYVYETGI